jgi:repressor LexA
MPLTKRQSEILTFLQGYIRDHGYAPSFEEIAAQFGFQSLATVHEHLTNLERKGYIQRTHNESRAIEVLPPKGQAVASEIPLLGKVAAGTPIEALMQSETLAVPDNLLPRRGPNYALQVQGSSMIDEHIVDGDFVVVHSQQNADNGELVIALINGSEATVKRFYREPGGWIRLQPANAGMQPMRFQERDVLIQGIVVGVIRKY